MTEQRIPSELMYDNTLKIYIYRKRERGGGEIYGYNDNSFAIGRILRGHLSENLDAIMILRINRIHRSCLFAFTLICVEH